MVRMREVLAGDEVTLAAWHEVYLRAQRHGRPWAAPWQLGEVRAELGDTGRRRMLRLVAGLDGEQVVCAGQIGMPLLDNTTTATVEVDTDPAHRRRGHGTAMLDHLLALGRAADRSTFFAEIGYPFDGPPDGTGSPGPDFATRHGFRFALGEVQRVLDLPVAGAVLERLAAAADLSRAAYVVEAFTLPVPERWVAAYAALDAMVQTEAPTGELLVEPQVGDVAAYRELEALLAAQQRTGYAAVALDKSGQPVAYSCVVAPSAEPDRCYQWGTLVHPDHRGHRLGLAVKVAVLRRLQREEPGRHLLVTFNAEANAAMVRINEQLGFRPVERLGEFQLLG